MNHNLKCWPEFFQAILDRRKRFEYRRNDRGFKVWDTLTLCEWEPRLNAAGVPHGYTGRALKCLVTYIMSEPAMGVPAGYCIMSIEVVNT